VQQAGPDLDQILKHLLEQGDLSDDLSLMRIDYAPQEKMPFSEESLLQQIDALRIKNLMQNKNYRQSLPLLQNARLMEANPHKLRRLDYLHGLALYKLGQFTKALPLLEEAGQRQDQPQALKLTAYCYYRQNQLEGALEYLRQYLKHTEDTKARQNAENIERRLNKRRELLGQKQGLTS
jgi:tetratricopeptide (TPR) repeat protein